MGVNIRGGRLKVNKLQNVANKVKLTGTKDEGGKKDNFLYEV